MQNLIEDLNDALRPGLEIERELEPGGMSRLFLARDVSLNRQVVLKLLPPDRSNALNIARFKKEIEFAARLNHPHILPILGAGEQNGFLYYLMPYVDGESLDKRLARAGRLTLPDALTILNQIADALSYAHRNGVVHRDIKPANVLLHEKHAIVADFGVARALAAAGSDATLTLEGVMVGTVGYMSPEQIGGEVNIDARSDVYSLAVVGYELLAGVAPFTGTTPQSVLAAHLRDSPKRLRDLQPDVPYHVNFAIMKGLAKLPEQRLQSAAEFRDALEGTLPVNRKENFIRAATLAEVKKSGCLVVPIEGHTVALFYSNEEVHALDNRCPHMGFPLHRGTVHGGILTCHWHHARFDLKSGGTFDPWADDVRRFPVRLKGEEIWIDVAPRLDAHSRQRARLREGLERNLTLVIAKSVMQEENLEFLEAFRVGVEFGTTYLDKGWGQGLTILACMMNLLPHLVPEDCPRALFHGLSAVASDCDGEPPRFGLKPLPTLTAEPAALKEWFRSFIEVRDAEGAERCVVSALRSGCGQQQMADMLFAAVTDHRYIQGGHVLDFTNKAFETLDLLGWDSAETVLSSLVYRIATAERMEESNSWRHPVDLVGILESAFDELPSALKEGAGRDRQQVSREEIVSVLLTDNPDQISRGMLAFVRAGIATEDLALAVAYAAALRIARFHASNEFGDWDTALHTFSFANAVHQGILRFESGELIRGIFDAAMSVYLDRFLNIPPASLPESSETLEDAGELLREFLPLLDRQQQVDAAGMLVGRFLFAEGDPRPLLSTLGTALLREDRDFHTIQTVEAAFRQYQLMKGTPAGVHVLVAAARYLAAHAPTVRAQGQTFQIARRLSRGDRLYQD